MSSAGRVKFVVGGRGGSGSRSPLLVAFYDGGTGGGKPPAFIRLERVPCFQAIATQANLANKKQKCKGGKKTKMQGSYIHLPWRLMRIIM